MITSTTLISLQPTVWKLSWTSDQVDPTFFVYRDGLLWDTLTNTEITFFVDPSQTPVFDVFDSINDSPGLAFPGQAVLNWDATPDTKEYRVEEFIAAVWELQKIITDEGQGYFRFQSRWLEDVTSHQFRVIAVGNNANLSTAKLLTVFMVRNPDPPRTTFAYDGAGPKTVTITAIP